MSFRQNPFDEMERMFDQMRHSMWGADPDADTGWTRHHSNVNLETDDEGYVVFADLPGFRKSEIDLRFDGDTLTIEATHALEDESSARTSVRNRRVYEQVRVPVEVLEDEITASYHNGVLEVHLPSVAAVEDDDGSISIDIEYIE